MKSTDSADATARALDILPHGDPAAADPRFLRAPHLIEEARHTREAAAEVWLAVSPLRVAPPEILHDIMEEIAPHAPAEKTPKPRLLMGIAAAGWAAAAVLLVSLWPQRENAPSATHVSTPPARPDANHQPSPPAQPSGVGNPRDTRLRSEIQRLQNQLEALRTRPTSGSPRVIALHSPGAPARSPEETRRRVQLILTHALRTALEAESGTPSDPASLVIERGWLAGGLPLPDEGGVVRHRNFPEYSWKELGLLRSDDGTYLDASGGMIWAPDPEGRGFIGRKITEADDLAAYHAEDRDPSGNPSPKPRMQPEGFIVENPAAKTAEVIIDQVPPPAEGTEHVVVLTDTSGKVESLSVTPPVSQESATASQVTWTPAVLKGPVPTSLFQNTGIASPAALGSSGTLIFTVSAATGLGSFQLIERTLIPNGQPDRVIVEGQP